MTVIAHGAEDGQPASAQGRDGSNDKPPVSLPHQWSSDRLPKATAEAPPVKPWLAANKFLVCWALGWNVLVWLGVFSLFTSIGEATDLSSWPRQQCIVQSLHVHRSFGCWGSCRHESTGSTSIRYEKPHDLYIAWVKVRTSDGRDLVAFPYLDGRPFETIHGIKQFQSRYTPAADGSPLSVPCVTNPRHAAELRCDAAPIEGDTCDVINAPARCRACLKRVFLGDESDVSKVVRGHIGGSTLALVFLFLIFVPVGLLACLCASPRCGDIAKQRLEPCVVAMLKSRSNRGASMQ